MRRKREKLSPLKSSEDREIYDRVANARFGGAHRYMLARDECGDLYTGPAWAPFNLWHSAEYGHGAERDCARVLCYGTGAEMLWAEIAARYPEPDSVALSLPTVCADAKARWAAIPRLTPSEFRKHVEKLARQAEQLAVELERFNLPRDPDTYEFPGLLDFTELMTKEEQAQLDHAIRINTYIVANNARNRAGLPPNTWGEYNDIGDDARALGYQNEQPYRPGYIHTPSRTDAHYIYSLMLCDHTRPDWPYGGVPSLPDMLRRIAGKFAESAMVAPLARPNHPNAERNFFARLVCKYFWQSWAGISPAIVRDVVCMFHPQGIDENEVSQMAAPVKAKFPLARAPENSGPT